MAPTAKPEELFQWQEAARHQRNEQSYLGSFEQLTLSCPSFSCYHVVGKHMVFFPVFCPYRHIVLCIPRLLHYNAYSARITNLDVSSFPFIPFARKCLNIWGACSLQSKPFL